MVKRLNLLSLLNFLGDESANEWFHDLHYTFLQVVSTLHLNFLPHLLNTEEKFLNHFFKTAPLIWLPANSPLLLIVLIEMYLHSWFCYNPCGKLSPDDVISINYFCIG